MSLPRGWLRRFLSEAFVRASPLAPERLRTRTHARRVVLASMVSRGLAFGAPQLRGDQLLSKDAGELLLLLKWLVVVADHVDLAGRVLDAPELSRAQHIEARVRALASALASVCTADEDALVLATWSSSSKVDKALASLERELHKRRYLQGNPLLGLTLYPAFSALDARAVVLAAVDAYGRTPTVAATQLQKQLAAQRTATLAAIAALSQWRELIDADLVRSASLWQVKALGLSRADTASLLSQAKHPADLSRLLTLVSAGDAQRIVCAVSVAAWVDGRLSAEEREFLRSLSQALGVSRALLARIDKRVSTFLRAHTDAFNPLALADGFAAAEPPISVRVARLVYNNIDALWNEIRETGDLALLLAKRASGSALDASETRRMREQLVDVVKTVPSLAVFALPGGFVLLPILLRLLPFDLRPSSFRRKEERFHAFSRGDHDVATEDDILPRS